LIVDVVAVSPPGIKNQSRWFRKSSQNREEPTVAGRREKQLGGSLFLQGRLFVLCVQASSLGRDGEG